MLFRQIFDEKLAQYAYLIGCQQTGEAIIIDPERDIDQYLDLAEEEGVEIVAVTETHIHADFLSGAREFAERLNTKLYLSDEGDENWKYEWVKQDREAGGSYDYELLYDGDVITIGNIEIQAVHTPGHTPEHMSFLVTDKGGGATQSMGIVTGDFVFVGDLGRPDLLESAAKVEGAMDPSARTLYDSVQRFMELPDFLQVWPAHGAGSACGKALGAVPQSTIGYEKQFNPMIDAAKRDKDTFVDAILEGQPEPQIYFARMKRDNKMGAPVLGKLPSPKHITARELKEVAEDDDALIIDTRLDRSAFMKRHIPGALYAPMNKTFNTVVGSLVEDETQPITLIVDEEDVEEAVRDLVRIGYDNVVNFASTETLERYFDEDGPVATIDEIDFDAVDELRKQDDVAVLDVRYRSEFDSAHVDGALNASYTRMPEYVTDLPEDKTFLVHCASGARAAAASAFLQSAGRNVKYVNDVFADYNARKQAVTA
ncbi:MBL fold metallo-hydrolase [Longibacter salinarum]|uniref:MBL fold metallo-hydrolase n=1 Tax=Longibacter salinarum TaxID=1850348 RepID=A0A2A8D2V6_9BACT|nr:MBL fold metallo-hydrolase [Longibacter salinarum]PEN15279.1 MBL fold metallo-hydrolase [Longibacter salinarum]